MVIRFNNMPIGNMAILFKVVEEDGHAAINKQLIS
jgi:hypothetical protein